MLRRAPEHEPLMSLSGDSLDEVPVYRITLAIRDDIDAAVDTSLTWDQLKSPQLNSFLVKPLMMKCRDRRTRAIIFCLLTNCAQYRKEAEEDSARAGVNNTKALACELLAVKSLKEFTARELIDVLTFDFWPLQGDSNSRERVPSRSQRISALELAIKAVAKKFLASALVVQILENIWKGNIVFYGASDKDAQLLPHKMRKAASTYDAREASIFKLSRLRVPRYRHWMQTISFAILLGLVIAVLIERQLEISTLEIVMVIYAIGFMLDEVVGLNDTGSRLFLSNLWNSLDMLTLLFFVAFFILRIWGFISWRKSDFEYLAYDLLAVNTVFLTPRLFSALDHTRQFSQMLIAFQRMAVDLVTSLIFILIFFAGFFLALSLAFARDLYTAKEVAFKLLQLVFGFSPAAWSLLPEINWIGKILLLCFMVNSNYLVITILVSVLSTTFSNVIANAHEEHQYLFALNTILAVKSDALFFFQAPLNLIEWTLAPLVLVMPRAKWIRLNRYFIKFTHFPMLLSIYLFERFYLRPRAFVPQDLLLNKPASNEALRLPLVTEGGRSISGHFFGRKIRKGSDVQQRDSEEALQQVFNKTQHARRQLGYGTVKPTPAHNQAGGKRTNDWVERLPDSVFSPADTQRVPQTPSDGTPEQVRKSGGYFDLGPTQRPPNKRSATAAGNLNSRWLPSTAIRERPYSSGSRVTSGAQSDPEDFQSMVGSPLSPGLKFSRNRGQRRPTMESTVDPELRAKDIDSGDDEMDEGAIAEETDGDETETEAPGVIHSGARADSAGTLKAPTYASPGRPSRQTPQGSKSRASGRRTNDQANSTSRAINLPTYTRSIDATLRNVAQSAPRSIRQPKNYKRRESGDVLPDLSSSLATQLAAHNRHNGGDDEDGFLQRMLLGRVDGIEGAMKGGNERIERIEGILSELVQEMKRARKQQQQQREASNASSYTTAGTSST